VRSVSLDLPSRRASLAPYQRFRQLTLFLFLFLFLFELIFLVRLFLVAFQCCLELVFQCCLELVFQCDVELVFLKSSLELLLIGVPGLLFVLDVPELLLIGVPEFLLVLVVPFRSEARCRPRLQPSRDPRVVAPEQVTGG
jgi:hypothetical protein